MTSGYSISLIRDPARGTSQLYLRVAWTSAGLVCSGILLTVCPDGWPKFQSFFNGLQSIATDDEKHYQCQNIVLNKKKNWTIIFGIQLVNSITVCTDGRSRNG